VIRGVYRLRAVLPDGTEIRRVAYNTLTHEGLRYLLDAAANHFLLVADPSSKMYFGFVGTSGFSAYSQTDTLSSHAGWAEVVALGGRKSSGQASAVAAADGLSSSKVLSKDYSLTSTDLVARGLFLSTTTDNSGIMWSAGDFNEGAVSIPSGSTLTATYTVENDS